MAQQPGTVAARRASNLSRPTKKPCSPIPFCINLAMNDDLLMEILLRLPAKSLIRFKSVCKKWRSLIFSDYFCHRHTLRRPKLDPLSLILQVHHSSKFFYFDGEKAIIPFGVPDHLRRTHIMQACNGLFLLETKLYKENEKPCDRACCNPTPENLLITGFRHLVGASPCNPPHGLDLSIIYFVYNPTTRQSREISLAHKHEYPCVVAVFLAFDPSESPFYKVVCIRASVGRDELDSFCFTFHIEIYDSESRNWKVSLEALTLPPTVSFFNGGVHWNNSIYWHSDREYFCFDIARNETKTLEFPRTPDFGKGVKEYCLHRSYLQESNGHLYHFEWSRIYNDRREFGSESVAVWELGGGGDDDHRSEWLFKSHHVVGDPRWIIGDPVRLVVGSDGDEACTLLTTTRSRRMRSYHFRHNKTYHEDLYDFYPDSVSGFQFGETLALVGRTAKLKNSRYSIGLKLLDIGRGRKLILRRSALVLSFNDSAMEREVYEVSVKHLGTMDEPKGMLVDLCP